MIQMLKRDIKGVCTSLGAIGWIGILAFISIGYTSPTYALETVFYDNFNRPDATGDAWGTPVVGGDYWYINSGNADFALSDSTGFLDDNTNVGDPQAVSEFTPVTQDFVWEFSWKYEGGRGSGLRLYDDATLVYGFHQEGYSGNLEFFNGSTWIIIEPRQIDVWRDYRVEITSGTAKVYIDDVLELTTTATMVSFDRIQFWAQGHTDGLGTSDSWYDDVEIVIGSPAEWYHDNFNRPDATGDAWGTPVVGGDYWYINSGNADFALSDSTGFLDDNTNVGDPQAVSEFTPVTQDFVWEFSWKYEGGRGSGLRLYDDATLVYGFHQEGYSGNLEFFNGSTWIIIEPRQIDVWRDYRVEITSGTAKVYIDDVLELTTTATMVSFDRIQFWAQGHTDGLGTSDSWYDDVMISPYVGIHTPPIVGLEQEVLHLYPNPTAGSVQIAYSLSADSWVQLAVYDVNGRLTQLLVDGMMGAGVHHQILSNLQPGVYFCHYTSGDVVSSSTRFVVIE